MVRQRLLTAWLVGSLLLSGAAGAAPAVDQEYLVNNGSYGQFSNPDSDFRRAQTFTAGLSGVLTGVDVVSRFAGSFLGINLLAVGPDGLPTGAVLGSGAYVGQEAGGAGILGFFQHFTLAVAITAGTVYALEPIAATGTNGWTSNNAAGLNPGPGYAGGADTYYNSQFNPGFAFNDTGDNDFRTLVEAAGASVPEPGTLALLGAGLVGLGVLRRRAG